MNQWVKMLIDLGPLVVFFVVNGRFGIIPATGAFMAATAAALVAAYAMTRKLPRMTLVSGAFVLVFGGLTIALHDDTFIKIKPTLVYTLFAVILFGGLYMGRHPLRYLLDTALPGMSEQGWAVLTKRWGWFFVVAAIANEIAWRNVSTDVWVGMKLWLFLPASLLFAMAQTPFILKNSDLGKQNPPEDTDPNPPVE